MPESFMIYPFINPVTIPVMFKVNDYFTCKYMASFCLYIILVKNGADGFYPLVNFVFIKLFS